CSPFLSTSLSCQHPPLPVSPPLFFFHCSGPHRDLHSFPTRRSSDLRSATPTSSTGPARRAPGTSVFSLHCEKAHDNPAFAQTFRSEEHTSELQSRENLVCRLLLEKKKKKTIKDSVAEKTHQHTTDYP